MKQKYTYGNQAEGINHLNDYLFQKRRNQNFRVLDVGGAIGPWFWDNTDFILDFVPPEESKITPPVGLNQVPPSHYNKEFICGDITLPEGWDEINKIVALKGKFDFVICRHTLEDLNHPEFVMNQLQKVAKSGFIGVPSKHQELLKGWYPHLPETRGLHHHRWIYVTKKGMLYGLPKMGWTDSLTDKELKKIKHSDPRNTELRFYWEDKINVFYVLPIVDNLPPDYGDAFIRKCLKGVKDPWDLWKRMLNDSD